MRSRQFPKTSASVAAFLICLSAFSCYLTLAMSNPVVYWGDAHVRLALRDQVLLGHWLPFIQILIVVISKFTNDLLVLRALLAVIAACVLSCMYVFARRLFSPGIALIATLFLSANLMFVALATVPYPEILFVGFLLIALNLLDGQPLGNYFYLGMIALNLACLTRYEGWLLAVIFVVEAAVESLITKNWRRFIQVALLSGIAPLGWLIFGISGSGDLLDRMRVIIAFEVMTDTESLGARFLANMNLDYLRAFASNYFHLLSWQVGLGIILLGVLGWLCALLFAERRATHWRIFAFVILDWLLLALWQPWNFSNLRTAFIGQVFLVLYAAYGLQQLIHFVFQWFASVLRDISQIDWQRWVITALAFILVYNSASSAVEFVKLTSQENDFAKPAQVGEWLKNHLKLNDRVLVLTDDIFQPYALAAYIGLPYDTILDDRFDRQQISSRIASSQTVYIIELYRMRDRLSAEETKLLNKLEDQVIDAQPFRVGSTRVWLISENDVDILKVLYD